MKKYLIAATFVTGLAGLGTMGMALADDDDCRVPMADWQPREAVQNMAEAQGWTVRRIKTDDGCYEIKGRDAQGREIEVKVDPGTLAIVEMEYDDDDDDDDDRGGRDMNQKPTGTSQPPANGLFVPGSKPGAVVQ
ncbi:PepSY domain-containing protein [Sneathiella sp. HT1-7]|uniref:PepSY domain-containing protein n=1 Tax=Sneathiella sp. HT1-7 TaxID=2887192 RepID=UPI001D156AF1|nr:PepSY domain-containing protein [Sneathiella sp. HT1-7]MCC3305095.1 PepSY domain-containing protein [Sneathiella sp. HT1-7]